MQQGVRFAASPDRHHEGVCDELRRHFHLHRPADDIARKFHKPIAKTFYTRQTTRTYIAQIQNLSFYA